MSKKNGRSLENKKKGFTLIELAVSMFILVMVMGAMVAVSVSIFRSYQKSRAVKTVADNINFALNSIAKDVRMGTIENAEAGCTGSGINSLKSCILVKRNLIKRNPSDQEQMACYKVDIPNNYIAVKTVSAVDVSGYTTCGSITAPFQPIVNLSGTGMIFASTSGFYSLPASATNRGWMEINLNIENPSMETDSIRMQTIVSSRSSDWKETQ